MTPSRYLPPVAKREPQTEDRRGFPPAAGPPRPAPRLRRPEPARPPRRRDHRRRLRVRLPRDDDHPDRRRRRGLATHLLRLLRLEGGVLLRDLRPDRRPPPRRRPRGGRGTGRVAGPGRRQVRRRARGLLHQPPARPLHARGAAAGRRRGDRPLPGRPRWRPWRSSRGCPRRRADAVAGGAALADRRRRLADRAEAGGGGGGADPRAAPDLVELFLTPFIGRAEAARAAGAGA